MESEVKMELCCRTCLKSCDTLTAIDANDEGDSVKIIYKLIFCISDIDWLDKQFPTFICNECLILLRTSYNFRKSCVTTNDIFQKYLKSKKQSADQNSDKTSDKTESMEVVDQEEIIKSLSLIPEVEDIEVKEEMIDTSESGLLNLINDESLSNDNCSSNSKVYRDKMDVFKIVHLVDLNEVEPVPYQWEEAGIVYWPKIKKECRQKQSEVSSQPDKENWMKLKGVVKAVEKNYNDAVKAADSYNTDMSTDDEISETPDNAPAPANQEPEKITLNKPVNTISDTTIVNTTDLSNFFQSLNEFKTNVQQQMTALQQQVAEVGAKQDHFEILLSQNNAVAPLNQRDLLLTDSGKIFPLDSVQDLNSFEQQLATDVVYKSEILEHWKCIIGTRSRWKAAAYKLCGFLFTTNILAKYSWTGVSRVTETKEAFHKLIEVLHLFYLVVKNADATFTIVDRDNFFKCRVLKHGQSRLNPRRSGKTEKISNVNVTTLNDAELGKSEKQEQNDAVDPDENGKVDSAENK